MDADRYLKSEKDGWIVASKRRIPPHNHIEEWTIFCRIIREKYSHYYPSLVKLYSIEDGSGSQCNIANMFITSYCQMAEYCEVLFDVCRCLRAEIGDTAHIKTDQRYCAFMAERFLAIYLDANRLPEKEVELRYKGWLLLKALHFATYLGIRRNKKTLLPKLITKILQRQ